MTNIDRAEAILTARHHKDQMEGDGAVGCFDAAAAAEELHAAGLLAPDLPEPDGHDADGLPYWGEGDYNTALTWHPCDRDVPRNERPLLIHSPISPWMHPDELEAEALRALAAAAYSKGTDHA